MVEIKSEIVTNNLGTKLTPEIEEMLDGKNQLERNAENFIKALEESSNEE